MITDDVRREAAKELRELATPGCIRYAEEFYEELREIVASDLDGSFDGVANSLADLIDRPTCKIILVGELRTAYGKPITGVNGYVLSCGHSAVGRMESSEAVARETARIIAEGIAKELGMTPGEEQTCDSR